MKKVLKYFSALLLTILAIGCSTDNANNGELKELIVKVDKMAIEEGEVVLFTAIDSDSKSVEDVDFYVNNIKVSNPYKFESKGTYNVIAKKNGFKMSSPKTILVGKVLNSKLELIVDKTEIKVGETVSFKVISNGVEISDYYIMIAGKELMLGNEWKPVTIGTYKFYAFKGEYLNSDIVTITVKDKPIDENQFFSINSEKYGVDEVRFAAHAQEEHDKIPQPYIYTDKTTGKKFQVYELVAMNRGRQVLVHYFIGVYVSDNETKFVYPSDAKAEDVFTIGMLGIIGITPVASSKADDIEDQNINWIKPLEPFDPAKPKKVSNGVVKYNGITKDKRLQVVYEGEFSGPSYVTIPKETKSVKSFIVY